MLLTLLLSTADLGPQDGWEYAADRYEELLATGYYIDMGDDGTPTSSDSDDMDDGVSSSQEDQHAPSSAPAAATAGEQVSLNCPESICWISANQSLPMRKRHLLCYCPVVHTLCL